MAQLNLLDYAPAPVSAPVPEADRESATAASIAPVPEAVPVPVGTNDDAHLPDIDQNGRYRFRNHSTNSSTISAGTAVPPKGGENSGTGIDSQAPFAGEGSSASLSLPAVRECRGEEPIAEANKPVSASGTGNTAPRLRPYQQKAISAVDAQFVRGIRSTLLVLPTGCGKTVCFAALGRLVVARGRRVLVLAHRTELLEQARNKLRDVGVWAGIEKADRRAGLAPVVVASVQTLRGKRLAQFDPKQFGLVVVDECHHAAATSYRAILDHFDGVNVLGVTATPDRADGKALGEVFDTVAYRYEMRDAIRDGWLAPIRARRIVVQSVDLSSVKTRAGDLASDQLAEVMATDEAVQGVVVPLLDEVEDRRTILFAVDVAHATAIADAINIRKPGAARVAHGELDAREREQILADFRAGAFQFLCNCALYTEGFDEPSIRCVAVVRPTKSRGLFVQMVGRGTRLLGLTLAESIANGKTECLILDFTGNAGRHKLVGPIDCLAAGENVDEDVRKEAERLLADDQVDLDTVLDEARAELEKRRREYRMSATAKWFAHDVDPFFGEELPPEDTSIDALEPATPEERRQLLDLGFKGLPPMICKGDARRMFAAVEARRKKGLCSLRQAKQLARCGIDGRQMSIAAAGARMNILAKHDWDPNRARHELRELVIREQSAAILNNGGES